MKIHWRNVFILVLGLVALALVLTHRQPVGQALATLDGLGLAQSADDRFIGLFILALICLCVVAAVRLITHNRK